MFTSRISSGVSRSVRQSNGVISASQSSQHDNEVLRNSNVEDSSRIKIGGCGKIPRIKIFGCDTNPEGPDAKCDNDEILERVEHLEKEINNLKSNVYHVKTEISGFKPQLLSLLKRKTGGFKANTYAMEAALVISVIGVLCLIFFLLVGDRNRSCGLQDQGREVAVASAGLELEGMSENEKMLERVEQLEKEINNLKSDVSNVSTEISKFQPELSALKMKFETRGFKVDINARKAVELLSWTVLTCLCLGILLYVHVREELLSWTITMCLCLGILLYVYAWAY